MSRPLTLSDFGTIIVPVKSEPDLGDAGMLLYQSNGMAGEAGEVANVVKKMVRNDEMNDPRRVKQLLEECGDTLFYMNRLLRLRGYAIEDAALALLSKLEQQKREK